MNFLPLFLVWLKIEKMSSLLLTNSKLWWNLGNSRLPAKAFSEATFLSLHAHLLSPTQMHLIHETSGSIFSIINAMKSAIKECKSQFSNAHWNCPTYPSSKTSNIFGILSEKSCKETSFIDAITLATTVTEMAKACSSGKIETCGCHPGDEKKSDTSSENWIWSGCGDNTRYANRFARKFIRMSYVKKRRNPKIWTSVHNSHVGRISVVQSSKKICKCQGLSGSCSMKVCWKKVSDIKFIGDQLKKKFFQAKKLTEVSNQILQQEIIAKRKRKNRSAFRMKEKEDLVYFEESPNFCFGYVNNAGRRCTTTNKDSANLPQCSAICCEKGFSTMTEIVQKKCNCTFKWCCSVQCESCSFHRNVTKCL